MLPSRSFRRVAVSGLLLVAGLAFVLQLVLGQPVAGVFGLVLLVVPAFTLSRAVGPRPLGWPDAILVTIAGTLATTVLIGTLAGLAPAGLSSRSIAILELVILASLVFAWRDRLVRGEFQW